MKKISPFSEIKENTSLISSKKTVLVGGCFDLIHYGHLTFLKKAKQQGNFLIVALESDEFIKKNKRKEAVHTQEQRAEILASLDFVDLIIKLPLFTKDEEYFNLINILKPAVIAVTEGDPQLKNKKKQALAIGATVRSVSNLINGFSTKQIIKNFA